jgi:DNA-binding winged helix-turn-helix (wHTH) protein
MEAPVATTSPIYQFGEFTLDIRKGCLSKGTEEIRLRPKVFETLKYLVQNQGRLVAKPELIQAVWPNSFVTDDSLVQCTLELRRALGDHDQKILKTVPRRGYLFNPGSRLPRPKGASDSPPPNPSSTSTIVRHPRNISQAGATTFQFLAPL